MKRQEYESQLKDMALRQWKLMYMHGISKEDALELMGVPAHKFPRATCYACKCAKERRAVSSDKGICYYCPVVWTNKEYALCCHDGSPFDEWTMVSTPREEKLTAYEVYRTIRDTWK